MKKRADPEKPAQLWLNTFSDLMNLLLCFFVLLFAMSNVYMGLLGLLGYWVKRLRKYDAKLYYILLSAVFIFIPKALFSGVFFDVEALILMVIIHRSRKNQRMHLKKLKKQDLRSLKRWQML